MKRLYPVLICIAAVMALCIVGTLVSSPDIDLAANSTVLIYNTMGFGGSGVIIKENLILTAGHVAQRDRLRIVFADNSEVPVTKKIIDTNADVGFLIADTNNLKPVKIGNSNDVKLGDRVFLIGAPYADNFFQTVTSGIISKIGTNYFRWKNLLQTDADAAPGSSGAALFNDKFELIGICVGGPNPGGGVTCCVPINVCMRVLKEAA